MRDLYLYKDESGRYYGEDYYFLHNTFFLGDKYAFKDNMSPLSLTPRGVMRSGCRKHRGKKLKIIRVL